MKRASRRTIFLLLGLATACGAYGPAGSGVAGERPHPRWQRLAPKGFSPVRSPQLYGTAERPLGDGTIFNYMDGGGVAYIEHGFVELFHAEYAGKDGLAISLDVFTMETTAQAQAALVDERICPAGGAPLGTVPSGQAFRFPPDYFVYVAVSNKLIYLHINDDRQRSVLDRFAVQLRSLVEKEEP